MLKNAFEMLVTIENPSKPLRQILMVLSIRLTRWDYFESNLGAIEVLWSADILLQRLAVKARSCPSSKRKNLELSVTLLQNVIECDEAETFHKGAFYWNLKEAFLEATCKEVSTKTSLRVETIKQGLFENESTV